MSAETPRGPCYVRLFGDCGKALTLIFEIGPDDILAYRPAGRTDLAIVGWKGDEIATSLLVAGCGIRVVAVHAAARVDAAQIATCAAALIKVDDPGEAMTPLYLAPAFLGPAKKAGQ